MNTFEKHFQGFPAFIERVLAWNPDFLVPVAKKGCKLIKTVGNLSHFRKNPDLIKYRSFFELTNSPVEGKRVAVFDDASQYTAALQEYRRFFENHGATVRTFSFVGHEDLLSGTRWKEDPLAEITKALPEPVYQEYILQQSYHLLQSGNHFDLDHLIFELRLTSERLDEFLGLLKTHGELLFVEDYFLKTQTRRFSLNQPAFFQNIPFLRAGAVSLGSIRKIKFAYDSERQTLCFSPLVFPTWDFSRADVGGAIFGNVPFNLPYKLPDFLDRKNKSALLRTYYNIYFTCVVSFAKAFVQAVLPDENLHVAIKRNDLDAVLGVDSAEKFISSVKTFISNREVFDFGGLLPVLPVRRKPRSWDFAAIIDDLRAAYERKVQKSKSRVGVHYYASYDTLFRRCQDPISLSEDLDYYCDFGVIVPEVFFSKKRLLRGCRCGEPNADYNWKRTQILIPLAIEQFRTELKKKEKEVEPTVLNKILANFVFDYPSEVFHELHCLVGEPYTYGTLVRVYHRHRAPNKPSIYRAEKISPLYEWDESKGAFRTKDKGKMIKEINGAFDDRQEIPYSEIVTYFKFFSRIYKYFQAIEVVKNPVDVLNMLSICREEHCFYCHVLYNMRTSLEDFGAYIDTNGPDRSKHLMSSKTNARSALDKVQLARDIDTTIKRIVSRFGREVEFVKAIDRLQRNYVPFGAAFQITLHQVKELVVLQLILTNLCLLIDKRDSRYADELRSLNCHRALADKGILLPESLPAFVQDSQQPETVINAVYSALTAGLDALPREEPMLAARLRNESRQRAKNVATSYVYKAKLTQAVLLYGDFSGLRRIPEPKEDLLSRYYQVMEQNSHHRGGVILYGGLGGDDMFTILFTDVNPALQCAKDIKKDFAEDLFLHSSKCDAKFGLSFVVFQGEQKEQQIIQCWGNAKDCCEFKGRRFSNRGSLLISQETLDFMRSSRASDLTDKFVSVQGETLKSGSHLFSFLEIAPLPE